MRHYGFTAIVVTVGVHLYSNINHIIAVETLCLAMNMHATFWIHCHELMKNTADKMF